MSIILAEESPIAKTDTEIKKIDFNFKKKMAAGATISGVVGGFPTVTPTGELVADQEVASGQKVQVRLSAGTAEQAFTADTTGVFTATGHGFSDGHTVRLLSDTSGIGLPAGVVEGTTYYVVSSDTNTFKLSPIAGGAAVTLTTTGQGSVFMIYLLKVRVNTSTNQTLEGSVWVQVRS